MRRWILLFLVVVIAPLAHGRELPKFFEGVRPLGMGGAFTAVADDENAVFYNPAGLDRVARWGMGVVNPLVEVGENGYDFARDALDTDYNDTSEVTKLIRDYAGESEHARLALFPHFVMRHLGVGVLGQINATLQPNNVIGYPELAVDALETLSGHVGVGFGFLEGALRVGATAKYVKAYRLRERYTALQISGADFEDRVRDDLAEGGGVGLDVGAMVTAPVLLKPTLAVVVQNLADTDLGDAGELPQQINVGVSVTQKISWLTLTGAADWVDIATDLGNDEDTYKRLHFGLEGKLGRFLALRAGLYQGYGSLGASVDLRALRLDYATYAAELGRTAGDRADRRHVIQLTVGW
jgi:hypothetical protein